MKGYSKVDSGGVFIISGVGVGSSFPRAIADVKFPRSLHEFFEVERG